jgi:1-phosphofructokinase
MIITLTLNPSLDRTVELEELVRGRMLRATSSHVDPGGKGVNVTRALLANGVASRAVLPCGGEEGQHLVRLLQAEGVDPICVWIDGHTRSNLTLAEPDGTVTKVNEPGPALSPADLERVLDEMLVAAVEPTNAAGGTDWVVICGSTPPGVTVEAVTQLCEGLVAAGVRLAVDTSGPALRGAATAGAALVKPNREELSEVVGRELASIGDVVDAARELRSWGAGAVLASLGADGAVLVDEDGVSIGSAPVDRPRSAVGAGDALLAGFLAAGAKGGVALAEALAWGAAAVSLPGSRMPGPDDLQRQRVQVQAMPARLDQYNRQALLAKLGQRNYQPPEELWLAEA